MTDDYVRAKIKEALAATDGDKHDAQKLLITWAVRDPSLLLGVTKPHLRAIVAALVEHALRTKGKEDEEDSGPDRFSKGEIDSILAGGRAPGDKRSHKNVPPPKSTERQASAMRKLAAAFTRKKK